MLTHLAATHPRPNPLDCSRPAAALLWGVIGAALAVAAYVVQGAPNAASLLRVGTANPLAAQIERELGPATTGDPVGHDGQLYYLIARDPMASASTVTALAEFDNNTPRYRYRRILFPLLGGGFGQFSARATLWGMIALTVLGMALAAIGTADLAFQRRASGEAVFLALLNLGAIVSVMLVTADVLALGLSLTGAAAFARGRTRAAIGLLALAALTKETYLLVPLALAATRWREPRIALSTLAGGVLPLAAWTAWLAYAIPDVAGSVANLGAPFSGIASVRGWVRGSLDGVQQVFAVFVAASVGLALVMSIVRRSMLAWLAVPWLALAAVAGTAVWVFPTNAARAFSMLWPLGILMLFERGGPRSVENAEVS